MDLSTLTEAQQQQLQQLHQQFQQHQLQKQQEQQQQQQYIQQEQQQHQELASQSYDPSQSQSYDQANQAYYAYYQYQPQYQPQSQSQSQSHQQPYPYYHPEYANSYQQQPSQTESTPVQPSGISIPPEPSQTPAAPAVLGQGQVQNQQNAYYPQPQGVGEQQNPAHPAASGLNPAAAAAVAALSQLTQFAGTMDAAERAMAGFHEREWQANNGGYVPMPGPGPGPGPGPMMYHGPDSMHSPVGRSPYRGGGRMGGGPFRRGGRGHFGHRHPRPDGSSPPFRGRGRGRGGGRRFPPHGAASTSPFPAPTSVDEPIGLMEGDAAPSADIQGEAPVLPPSAPVSQSASAPRRAAPIRQPAQIAWCEVCRVDCTSLEILEQHKNGKRHKKTVQRFEELHNANKPMVGMQNEQKPIPELKPEVMAQPENVPGCVEEDKPLPENLPTEAITDENKMKTEHQNDLAEQSEVAMAEQTEVPAMRPRMDRFDAQRRGIKRKMRGGRGGKRMRFNEGPRRPVEPPKPKEVIPLICDLCNVKCDTEAVFDSHLAGKKHLSKLKRFQGHQAMFGTVGLQVLYPPNPNAQPTYFIPQGHQQAVYGPQGPLPQPAAYMFPQAQAAAAGGSDNRPRQYSNPQGSQVTLAPGSQKASHLEPKPPQAVHGPRNSLPQPVAYMLPQSQAAAAAAAGGSVTQPRQDSKPQGSHITLDPESEKAIILEPKPQQAAYDPQGSLPQPAAYMPPQDQQAVLADSEIQPLQDSKPQESQVTMEPGSEKAIILESMPQQAAYDPHGSLPQTEAYMPPQAQQVAAAGSEIQPQQDSKSQESQVTMDPESEKDIILEAESQQAAYDSQGSLPQPAAYMPEAQQAAAAGSETQPQQDSNPQESGSLKTVMLEPESQQQSTTIEPESQQAVSVETKSENGILVFEGKEVNPSLGNSVTAPSKNSIISAEQVLPATAEAVPVLEYGVISTDHVVLPGLDIKMEEPGSKNEEPIE